MNIELRFKLECNHYKRSGLISVETDERYIDPDTIKHLSDMTRQSSLRACLYIINHDNTLMRMIRFDDCVKMDGNHVIFMREESVSDGDKPITLIIRLNHVNVPDNPSFVEMITEDTIDNVCLKSQGKKGYLEFWNN